MNFKLSSQEVLLLKEAILKESAAVAADSILRYITEALVAFRNPEQAKNTAVTDYGRITKENFLQEMPEFLKNTVKISSNDLAELRSFSFQSNSNLNAFEQDSAKKVLSAYISTFA